MRIAKERSDWLASVEHVWIEFDQSTESAPCIYNPKKGLTWIRFRLWLRQPFKVDPDEVPWGFNDMIDKNDPNLPEYLRNALADKLFDEVFLLGPESRVGLVTSVMINIDARGKLKDSSRFRDFVVRKLLKK